MILLYALLAVGAVLALAGYFGPEDEGVMQIAGFALIAFVIWKGWHQLP